MKDNPACTLLMCFKQTGVPSAGLSHKCTSACWKQAKTETSGVLRSKGTEENLDCLQDNPPGSRGSKTSHCQSSLLSTELHMTELIHEKGG